MHESILPMRSKSPRGGLVVRRGEETPGAGKPGLPGLPLFSKQNRRRRADPAPERIPVAAGLAEEANAATVLMGLKELFGAQIEDSLLMAWGAGIGADVPFFIFKKPAWAGGKGEKLEAAKLPTELWFLLLVPPFRISTAWAYAAYDRLGVDKPGPFLVQRSFAEVADLSPVLHNDLERASIGRFPEIGEMKEKLREQGAAGALMSGSGPVVFGLFRDPGGMKRAEERLSRPAGWRVIPAKGI
jgi:4-diphosphocytidyl-2-C-methyl-D-erythritol kinase